MAKKLPIVQKVFSPKICPGHVRTFVVLYVLVNWKSCIYTCKPAQQELFIWRWLGAVLTKQGQHLGLHWVTCYNQLAGDSRLPTGPRWRLQADKLEFNKRETKKSHTPHKKCGGGPQPPAQSPSQPMGCVLARLCTTQQRPSQFFFSKTNTKLFHQIISLEKRLRPNPKLWPNIHRRGHTSQGHRDRCLLDARHSLVAEHLFQRPLALRTQPQAAEWLHVVEHTAGDWGDVAQTHHRETISKLKHRKHQNVENIQKNPKNTWLWNRKGK